MKKYPDTPKLSTEQVLTVTDILYLDPLAKNVLTPGFPIVPTRDYSLKLYTETKGGNEVVFEIEGFRVDHVLPLNWGRALNNLRTIRVGDLKYFFELVNFPPPVPIK